MCTAITPPQKKKKKLSPLKSREMVVVAQVDFMMEKQTHKQTNNQTKTSAHLTLKDTCEIAG